MNNLNFIYLIILGVVEGLTEFLPVSSTAHLLLVSWALGLENTEFLKTFEIVIQLGAISAVFFLYLKKLFTQPKLVKKILWGFVPTGISGFIFYPWVRVLLARIDIALVFLFVGGVFLILFEKFFKEGNFNIEDLSVKKSFFIGCFQALAFVPGVSRAAASIIGGMLTGLSKRSAVEFSFLLALPTIFAAAVFELAKNFSSLNVNQWHVLGSGFIIAFLSSLVSIKFLLRFVQTNTFVSFGLYRIVLSFIVFFFIFF